MRKIFMSGAALIAVTISGVPAAGTNDLFEAKTATAAIEDTSKRVLGNATWAERRAKRTAIRANRKASKAYRRCPEKPRQAERALVVSARHLEQHQRALDRVRINSAGVDALADFGDSVAARVAALLASDEVCDSGHTLIQEDLEYVAAAPFVSFARGWGDRQFGAHGTLGDFAPQSAAPDHLHGETYYGVVIRGTLRNPFGEAPGGDLASAKDLPPGSFWAVPANAIHTTACVGAPNDSCLFYFHSRGAFDFDTDISNGEVDDDGALEISFEEIMAELGEPEAVVSPFARMVTVWGDRTLGAHGTIGEFIPGGTSPAHSHSFSYHGVVLSGTMANPFQGEPIAEAQPLAPGDYWFVPAGVEHVTACLSAQPCLFYFHSEGLFDFLVTTEGN